MTVCVSPPRVSLTRLRVRDLKIVSAGRKLDAHSQAVEADPDWTFPLLGVDCGGAGTKADIAVLGSFKVQSV